MVEYLQKGQTINMLCFTSKAVNRKCYGQAPYVLFHQDNFPANMSVIAMAAMIVALN